MHLRHRDTLTMLVGDMTLLVQAPIADRFRTPSRWPTTWSRDV